MGGNCLSTSVRLEELQKKLGEKLRVRQRKPLIMPEAQEKRLVRGTTILNNLKSAATSRIIFFSDEKNFTVSEASNRRNLRYVALPDGDVDYSARHVSGSRSFNRGSLHANLVQALLQIGLEELH